MTPRTDVTGADETTVEVDGREVGLPCEVREATAGSASFLVKADVARDMLPGGDLDVVTMLPGQALLTMTMVDYRDNDLGDYDELSIALAVRRRSDHRVIGRISDVLQGRIETCILHLPVNQEFSVAAGRQIWGFPKTLERLRVERGHRRGTCWWTHGGETVLALSVPRGGSRSIPEIDLVTYTTIDGRLHETSFRLAADGVRARPAGGRLVLGEHPVADELRRLGLPRPAIASAWMERLRGRFEAPVPVT